MPVTSGSRSPTMAISCRNLLHPPMKHPNMQIVMQSACILVASLALAQAEPAQLSSAAKQTPASNVTRKLSPTLGFPLIHRILDGLVLKIDDGTAESAFGFSSGGDLIALNGFESYPTPDLPITSVSIAWGTPVLPDPSLNGLSYTAVIWSDPNGDGNPDDAVVVAVGPGVVSQAGTDTFVSTSFYLSPPLYFFAGFIIHYSAGQLPAALDETPPTYSGRSFVAGGAHGNISNLNDNDFPVAPSENYGAVGNWLIRAVQGGDSSPPPHPLWYNGDFDGVDGLSNEQDTFAQGYSHVYDDFNVTDELGWDVSSVYSNDLISTVVTGATWEIHQGITPGNGGTVVSQGMTTTPLVLPTGRSGFGYTEYTVSVPVTGVHLDPGSYYLNVTPIGSLDDGRSFDSTTSGANCAGTPCGNNDNSFFDSPLIFGVVFGRASDQGSQFHDFSMGVIGTVTTGEPLALQSAFSRKRHGAAGEFDLPLPLTGAEGIESRGGRNDSISLTFNHNLIEAGSVVSSCGSATVSLDPDDAKNLIVTVHSQSCNAMNITLTVDGILDDQGDTGMATLTYGKLIGDVNASGVVDSLDGQAIQAVAPSPVDSSNFRDDLNRDGSVNASDLRIAKSHRGERLP